MKYICLISHNDPGHEPGRFKSYVAGEVYDLDCAEHPLFRRVHALEQASADSDQMSEKGEKQKRPAAGRAGKKQAAEVAK